MLKVIIFGPQGSGKGTQGDRLQVRASVPHIATGQMLRDEIATGSGLGKKISSYIDDGGMIPDELMDQLIIERLEKADCAEGYILDGYPRNLAQAEFLDKLYAPDKIIFLDLPKEKVMERLSGRLTCPKCGAVYHQKFSPSAKGEFCERCGTKLVTRVDDTPEGIAKRLGLYEEETKPLKEYYDGRLILIDAAPSIEEVALKVWEALGI